MNFFADILGIEATAKNKVGEDGILRSPRSDDHLDLSPVNGSFYIELMQSLNKKLNAKGDWIWLKNCLTNDVLVASEVENLTKRYVMYIPVWPSYPRIFLKFKFELFK